MISEKDLNCLHILSVQALMDNTDITVCSLRQIQRAGGGYSANFHISRYFPTELWKPWLNITLVFGRCLRSWTGVHLLSKTTTHMLPIDRADWP